jgi:hypothetical protein
MNKPAGALLLIVLVTAILLTSITVLWRAVSISYESAILHYKAKQNSYACESLILYAIALIKHDLVLLDQLKIDQKQIIYQGNWPKQGKSWGVLTVHYKPKISQLEIQASLFGNDHIVPIAVANVLCQNKKQDLTIVNWQLAK